VQVADSDRSLVFQSVQFVICFVGQTGYCSWWRDWYY
jgi:hypothetical protein